MASRQGGVRGQGRLALSRIVQQWPVCGDRVGDCYEWEVASWEDEWIKVGLRGGLQKMYTKGILTCAPGGGGGGGVGRQ